MSSQHLLVRRDDRNPEQVAEACSRFRQRTGIKATVILVKAGTKPPAGVNGLRVVESVGVGKAEFGVGCLE